MVKFLEPKRHGIFILCVALLRRETKKDEKGGKSKTMVGLTKWQYMEISSSPVIKLRRAPFLGPNLVEHWKIKY
jgi:hypothetical protein